MSTTPEVRRLATPQDLFQAAADEVIDTATRAVSERGQFTIALSGGSTPKSLYTLIAANAASTLPWERMFFFWSDERHVPPGDAGSNYRMANESLLSKVPVPPANIFRIPGENPDASQAAEIYEQTIRKHFASDPGQIPVYDLILLGLGPDGHTASLFPETAALQEKSRLVMANWVEKFKTTRITFTLPLLNAASRVAFLVSGTEKAAALREVLEGTAPEEKYPAKLVRPRPGKAIWFVDRAAASELSAGS